jgi:hypothetical protein
MLTGVLIAESLRVGSTLSGVPLRLNKIFRIDAGSAVGEQPEQWTLVEFHAPAADAERLAEALAGCLRPTGGWYANFNTQTEAFVIFADRIFRYPRGEAAGRDQAKRYARSVGVPEPQLDWDD